MKTEIIISNSGAVTIKLTPENSAESTAVKFIEDADLHSGQVTNLDGSLEIGFFDD